MPNSTHGQQAVRHHVRQFVEEYRPFALSIQLPRPSEHDLQRLLLRLAEALEQDPTVTTDPVTGSDVRPEPQLPHRSSIPTRPLVIEVPRPRSGVRELLNRLMGKQRDHPTTPAEPQRELARLARRRWEWGDGEELVPGSVVILPPATVFCYDPQPNRFRGDVLPRSSETIHLAYFGGEKWRTTMRALLEIALHDPRPPKVPTLRVHLPTGAISHGADGTHRLLAAYLWGAPEVQVMDYGCVHSQPMP